MVCGEWGHVRCRGRQLFGVDGAVASIIGGHPLVALFLLSSSSSMLAGSISGRWKTENSVTTIFPHPYLIVGHLENCFPTFSFLSSYFLLRGRKGQKMYIWNSQNRQSNPILGQMDSFVWKQSILKQVFGSLTLNQFIVKPDWFEVGHQIRTFCTLVVDV